MLESNVIMLFATKLRGILLRSWWRQIGYLRRCWFFRYWFLFWISLGHRAASLHFRVTRYNNLRLTRYNNNVDLYSSVPLLVSPWHSRAPPFLCLAISLLAHLHTTRKTYTIEMVSLHDDNARCVDGRRALHYFRRPPEHRCEFWSFQRTRIVDTSHRFKPLLLSAAQA